MAASSTSTNPRPAAVENWDDDPDFASLPSSSALAQSIPTTAKSVVSSRLSARSDSNAGDDDWSFPVTPLDPTFHADAISSANAAGIPIPSNVPSSALVGGTIKRLGGANKRKQAADALDDWADDLDLPGPGAAAPLQLKPRAPATPALDDDFDVSWAEGSLGVRFAGARRDSRNRSSNASAMSPSLGSCLTVESDDDGLGGLVLPDGPLDFQQALKRRRQNEDSAGIAPARVSWNQLNNAWPTNVQLIPGQEQDDDDFASGLGLAQGEFLDPRKRSVHGNVKASTKKTAKPPSSHTRAQASISFADRSSTRIPRPVSGIKTPARLEPVLEAGAQQVSRPRWQEPTTTSAQLLRSKRSMPVMRSHHHVLNKAPSVPTLGSNHHTSPQGPSASQRLSQHHHSRRESDSARPLSPTVRAHSRLSSIGTIPDTPTRNRRDVAPAALAREAAAKRSVTRPARRKNFGDGTELDSFDDLPTSATKESRFVKQPHAKPPPPKYLRSQSSQSRLGQRDKMSTPQPPSTPFASSSQDSVPRFARDTAASRIAREQTIGQPARASRDGPLAPRTNWAAQVAARSPYNSPQSKRTLRKVPTLINPMGKENTHHFQEDAMKKGMHWNAAAGRWEGNDAAVADFGVARGISPPRPALISNMATRQGVQVVGGMVFDPQRMCWLKMGEAGGNGVSSPAGGGGDDDDDDPFKDIEDLADARAHADGGGGGGGGGGGDSTNGAGPEWLVGEEFDLGPAFIQRQRDEETAWRARLERWFVDGPAPGPAPADASIDALREVAWLALGGGGGGGA